MLGTTRSKCGASNGRACSKRMTPSGQPWMSNSGVAPGVPARTAWMPTPSTSTRTWSSVFSRRSAARQSYGPDQWASRRSSAAVAVPRSQPSREVGGRRVRVRRSRRSSSTPCATSIVNGSTGVTVRRYAAPATRGRADPEAVSRGRGARARGRRRRGRRRGGPGDARADGDEVGRSAAVRAARGSPNTAFHSSSSRASRAPSIAAMAARASASSTAQPRRATSSA